MVHNWSGFLQVCFVVHEGHKDLVVAEESGPVGVFTRVDEEGRYPKDLVVLQDEIHLFGESSVSRHDAATEVILLFAAIVGSMLVSYVRARAEGLGLDAEIGIMRRTVRISTLAVGLMINQVTIALWLLAVLTNLTAGQRLFYVWQKTKTGESKES